MTAISNKDIYDAIQGLREEVQNNYVTKDAFDPVKRLVYGVVAVMLTAVIVSLLGMVVVSTSKTGVATTSNDK